MTLPFSHAPALLLALFSAQVVHEAGHFLAAALPPAASVLHVGVGLLAILPNAFVELDTATPSLPVAAAGSWHNVLLAALLSATTLGRAIMAPLWHDASQVGVVVVDVDAVSKAHFSASRLWSAGIRPRLVYFDFRGCDPPRRHVARRWTWRDEVV